jgi:CRISPR-associated endonuclease/helicase Cas3
MSGQVFWAKTTSDGRPGISVFEHMLNVGCVASFLAQTAPELLMLFQIRSEEIGTLAALHDLGKISPGFQRKCEVWLQENDLVRIARNGVWDTAMEPNHGKVTQITVQPCLVDHGMSPDAAQYVAAILGGHHGRLQALPDTRGLRVTKGIAEERSGIEWDKARESTASDIVEAFGGELSNVNLGEASPSLWWLAGLTTVADWIGSDEGFFSPTGGLADIDRPGIAKNAVEAIGFGAPEIARGLTFADLFRSSEWAEPKSNDMQVKTVVTITGPGVYVIEAPMGTGKTEAALWAAYGLLAAGKARGIYFALPTQATSNRMHLRMEEFVKRIAPNSRRTRLIHGNSWLMEQILDYHPASSGKLDISNDARVGYDWFASAKRALLASFGVGTVDQALLGIVAAKHFFVRHFALAGKIVILDEVHSYDLYTGTLIDRLVDALEGLGCTVVILSATLSGKRREQIMPLGPDGMDDPAKLPYPIITGRTARDKTLHVPADPPPSRDVAVEFLKLERAIANAVDLASHGGVVLWICDTVDAAQDTYRKLSEQSEGRFLVGLVHSRFPFWRREELENEWMERLGKNGTSRCGSILVSTQVVEQSVDLDADLLITELAPTDMLLQRIGRLWRHERGDRPIDSPHVIILEENQSLDDFLQMDANDVAQALGGKAYVYAPYVLLRSLRVWKAQPNVMLPLQIRNLIEATYGANNDEPESWRELFDKRFATELGKKFMAARNCNLWQPALDDKEGVQTRLNEVPTIAVVLCFSANKKSARFIDGQNAILGGDNFVFATAQAIHRNLVKVPLYVFEENAVSSYEPFRPYIYEIQTLGLVQDDGQIFVKGLKQNTLLRWSVEFGIEIENHSSRSRI